MRLCPKCGAKMQLKGFGGALFGGDMYGCPNDCGTIEPFPNSEAKGFEAKKEATQEK